MRRLPLILILLLAQAASGGEWTIRREITPGDLQTAKGPLGWRAVLENGETIPVPGQPILPCIPLRVPLPAGEKLADWSASFGRCVSLGEFDNWPVFSVEGSELAEPDSPLPVLQSVGEARVRGRRELVFLWRPLTLIDDELHLSGELDLHLRSETDLDPPLAILRQDRAGDGEAFLPSQRPALDGSAVDAVIVCTEELAPAFQELADWHTARGTRCVVRSREWIESQYPYGVDGAENIRFFLQDAASLWNLQAVIIGGDTDQIPVRYAVSRMSDPAGEFVPTDLYYACLDGDWNADGDDCFGEGPHDASGEIGDEADLDPELIFGRIPVSTPEQAGDFVSKLIAYRESQATGFQERMLFLAEVLYPDDWTDGDVIYLDGAGYATTIIDNVLGEEIEPVAMFQTWQLPDWEEYAPAELTVDATIDSLDSGRFAVVDQIGHGYRYNMSVGDGSLVIPQALALSNENLFHLTLMNCSSTAFDFDCLGESFLRNGDGGAISVLGTTRSSYAQFAFSWEYDFNDNLTMGGLTRLGENMRELYLGKSFSAHHEGYNRWTFLIMSLLGDPLLDIWAGEASEYEIAAPDTIAVGDQVLDFSVTAGGLAAEDVRLTLYREGDVFSTGLTDAAGGLSLPAAVDLAGELRLTAWGRNGLMQTLPIAVIEPESGCVHLAGWELLDDPATDPLNNDDGLADAGETLHLLLDLKNAGMAGATGVSAQIGSLHDSLTVTVASESFGDIAAGETSAGGGQLELELASGVSDRERIGLLLHITADGLPDRVDTLTLDSYAPEPVLVYWQLEDSTWGNGNGIIEPGEELGFLPEIANLGRGATGVMDLTLTAGSGDITVIDGTAAVSSLELLDSGGPAQGLRVSLADPEAGAPASWVLADALGRETGGEVDFLLPPAPAGLVAEAGGAADRLTLSWSPVETDTLAGYLVYYRQDEALPFSRANLMPVPFTAFSLEGLAENSETWIHVRAVRYGGMLGLPSAALATSTNPAQLSGFPQELAYPTSSSFAVGNVAADQGLELVGAADFVYVWNADGTELLDGDGDAQSHGIFSTSAVDMAGAVTLLPLLDNGYRQILVAARDHANVDEDDAQPAIYALGADGSVLPGWPQATEDWVWVSILGADLDGDEDLEIVALDKGGKVYAFHHDGSELVDGDSNAETHGVLATGLGAWPNSAPAAADLDGDGAAELAVMGREELLHVFRADGSEAPGWPVDLDPADSTLSYESKAPVLIANIDGDESGTLEILVQSQADSLYAFNADGSPFPGYPIFVVTSIPYIGPGPVPLDLDDDGDLELLVTETFNYGDAWLHLWDHLGNELPGWPVNLEGSTQGSPIVGDVDGDGMLEFMVGLETGLILGFNADGSVQPGFPIDVGGEVRGTPLLADLDGDGDVEMIVGAWNKRVLAWDFAGAFSAETCPWPTLSGNYYRSGFAGFWDDVPVALFGLAISNGPDWVSLFWQCDDPSVLSWDLLRQNRVGAGEWSGKALLAEGLGTGGQPAQWRDEHLASGEEYRYFALAHRLGEIGEEFELGAVLLEEPSFSCRLLGNHPNPFNPSTRVLFESDGLSPLKIEVLSPSGRRLCVLADGVYPAGPGECVWDGRDEGGRRQASGVYLLRFTGSGQSSTGRLVLLK